MNRWVAMLLLGGLLFPAASEPPDIEYIYPAGGQRGTVVPVRFWQDGRAVQKVV